MHYKCKKFKIEELVGPRLCEEYAGREYLLWHAIDDRVLRTSDRLRFMMDTPITINNWKSGGSFSESGLRDPWTKTGSLLSAHKFGRAADLKFDGNDWTPEGLRSYMEDIGCFEPGFQDRTDDEAYPFILINRIEWMDEMSWFHFDVSPLGSADKSIKIVRG